jgi:nucleoside-diphosphate-sugar epimerase
MIVITTPTGEIGRQVLDRVLDSGEAARVIARDPSRLGASVRAHAEVVPGSHGDADVITKALAGADRLFWLVPPPPFSYPGSAERYYLDFTRPACEAIRGLGAGVVGVSTLGHGYQGKAGLLSAALAMDTCSARPRRSKSWEGSPWRTPQTGRCRPSPPGTSPPPPQRSCSTGPGAARPASPWPAPTT